MEESSQPVPYVIAGPCSAESPRQLLETARALKALGIGVFRAGLWKPRTHPGGFEGVGAEGLAWLQAVRRETGMAVCTEAGSASHAEACLAAGMDMVWIGARTTANPFLVQEIAEAFRGSDIPVMVKNPVSPDLELWAGAIERFFSCGLTKVSAIHRGFTTPYPSPYRNAPLWELGVRLRLQFPDIPFIVDPSHMAGDKSYIKELSQKALDLGADGLMIESHYAPDAAKSDSAQQLSPEQLGQLLEELSWRRADSNDEWYLSRLESLRSEIDHIDSSILSLLAERMEVSREIGRLKAEHNISILQTGRWEAVLSSLRKAASEAGLEPSMVEKIFNVVHDYSVLEQEKDKD